jgi:hypothetical protein
MFLTTALEDLAFLEARDQLAALLGARLLEHGAARDDDVAARAVHLEDLEGLRRAHQRGHVAHRADVDLAAGKERDRAAEVDREAAFDAAEDHAADALLVAKAFSSWPHASSRLAFSRLSIASPFLSSMRST